MLKHVMVVLFYHIFQIILVRYIFVKFEGSIKKYYENKLIGRYAYRFVLNGLIDNLKLSINHSKSSCLSLLMLSDIDNI